MGEEETVYATFQTIAADELLSILGKIASPRWLTFAKRINPFVQRAIPAKVFSTFEKIVYLEGIKSAFSSTGVVCCVCFDSSADIEYALEKLALLEEFEKYLIIIPRVTTLCQETVERAHLKKLTLMELHVDVVPLESYMFVVPAPYCFRRCFIEGDITDIYTISRSLLKLQLIKGVPTRIFTAGAMATRVYELMEQQKMQIGLNFFSAEREFDELFIIDRTCDLVTPLVTQMTYGGYMDDRFDVQYGLLNLPKGVQYQDLDGNVSQSILLSDASDGVYSETRGLTMLKAADVIGKMQREISEVQDQMKEAAGFNQWNVHRKRAERLLELKPLISMHLDLSIKMNETGRLDRKSFNFEYDMLIQSDNDRCLITQMLNSGRVIDAIRLLCLDSCTSGGVQAKTISDIQRRVIGQCGFDAVGDFINLEKCGLLKPFTGLFDPLGNKKKWGEMRKKLHLVLDELVNKYDADGNDLGPADVGESYSQYVPLLVRLVQSGMKGDWNGGTTDQLLSKAQIPHAVHGEAAPRKSTIDGSQSKKVLVFVVGGVTESEVSIFRQLGKIIFDDEMEFHVGSTTVTTGSKLIREVCPAISARV